MRDLALRSSQPAQQPIEPTMIIRCGEEPEHLDQDDGDVVVSAVVLRGLHEVLGGEMQIRLERTHDQLDVGIVDEVAQAVGAQHIDVSWNDFVLAQVRSHARLDSERSGDEASIVRLAGVGDKSI